MPLNTVQFLIKKVLDGIQLPLNMGPLSAYITPPDPGNGMIPSAYIWGSVGDDNRRSFPRTMTGGQPGSSGFRVIVHEIDIWLIWFGPADDINSDKAFPAIVDAVCQALRVTPMPVLNAKDPVTGQNSNIEMIAERLRWDYSPVHSVDDQRWLCYTARIVCDVKEQVQD